MRERLEISAARVTRPHRFQWLWEPLETDPTFVLRPMFGGKSVYLDGKLMLYFSAKTEPWQGLLVCTERDHHSTLLADFPILTPHPILPKWLYLPERSEDFESGAMDIVERIRVGDQRFGVEPKERKGKKQ